jgi:uncharacterized membrane protein YhfC
MYIQLVLSVMAPAALIIALRKKHSFRWKPLFIGIAVFIVFSQILEKVVHLFMINPTGTALKWSDNPYLFAVYGAVAAGLFEEIGRYAGFRFMLRKQQPELKDGMSYAAGHGGIEALLIGVAMAVNSVVMASAINAGAFEQLIGPNVPAEQALKIKELLVNTGFWNYVLGGLERVFALCIQVGLSLLVLLAVRRRRFSLVVLAIGLHSFIDFFAALYQTGMISSIWLVEGIFLIAAAAAVIWSVRSKKLLYREG